MMSALRFRVLFRSSALISNIGACAPKTTGSFRNFGVYKEAQYMVVTDDYTDEVDPADISFAWLKDSVRIEMYKKHKEDPKLWSAKKLSMHYKASYNRVLAVLGLLQLREDMIVEEGFQFNPETAEPIIPSKWAEVYAKHKENPELNFTELATACEMEGQGSDVKDIVTRMANHAYRAANLADGEEEMNELAEDYAEIGVDPNFREAVQKGNDKWKRRYYPKMTRDEDLEAETARLMRNIELETKASVIKDMYYYVKKHTEPLVKDVETTDGITDTAVATDGSEVVMHETISRIFKQCPKPVHDHTKVTNFRRTKLAFRDLSFQNYRGSKGDVQIEVEFDPIKLGAKQKRVPYVSVRKDRHEFACAPPTMILTRGGVWRRANPLEESQRSWTQHPKGIDMISPMNKVKLAYLNTDWDGDEELVKAQEKIKNDKRRVLLAAAGVKKQKK